MAGSNFNCMFQIYLKPISNRQIKNNDFDFEMIYNGQAPVTRRKFDIFRSTQCRDHFPYMWRRAEGNAPIYKVNVVDPRGYRLLFPGTPQTGARPRDK